MAQPIAWNHAKRGTHKQYAQMTLPNPQRHVVPTAVLTQSKLVSINAVRLVSTAFPKIKVTRPRQSKTIVTKPTSPLRRNITHSPTPKASNFPPKVTAAKASVGNPQHASKDKGVIDSGCSRHMTRNMSYMSDFEELNDGYVAFGDNLKGGKISGKGKIRTGKLDFEDVYFVKELKFNLFSVSQMCDKKNSVLFTDTKCLVLSPDFKLPDESQVMLRVPRENNMYNVNLKNIVLSTDLTCLFAKATLDEFNLWHRRLSHIYFKTMNKLVTGNLVKGLPSKVFENDHTCVACKKGKQHKASCKTKPVSSVNQPLYRLHMDLFRPTFVKILNKKSYCLVVTDDYSRFTWVFFLATKDETNTDLNQFCGMKRIKREFSVPRTPQQNDIAETKNRTLIEAARTKLADSLLPISFWVEAVNTAGYVQNRVLVTKPQNKTPYELLHGRTPSIGFMRPFGCHVTILTTLDFLRKFDRNVDEGFLVRYYAMNYQPVTVGNQSNPSAGIQEQFVTEKAREESFQQYVLFPIWSSGSIIPQNTDGDAAFDEKEPEFEGRKPKSEVNVSPSSSAQSKKHDDKTKREAKGKSHVESLTRYRNLSAEFEDFSNNSVNKDNAAELEDITYSDDEDDVGAEADFNNFETSITVSPIPTTRVHKYHHVTQIIGDLSSATQTRSMTRVAKNQGGLSQINNDDFHTCMFGCFLSQEEPKSVHQALKDPSWIEAMQEELLQFKMQKVWVLVDLPHGKRAIGTKWVFRNKNDERGIVVRKKARLYAQGHTHEEGINYEEVFAPFARIEAIRLFLAYASFMGFMVYQMDVKSAFLYETIEEEVYVCQPPGFEDSDYPDKIYVDDIIFGSTNKDLCKAFEKLMKDKFQMSLMGELTLFLGIQVKQKKDGIFISQDKYVAEILRKFGLTDEKSASTPIDTEKPLLKDPDVKRIFRYLKGKPHLGLWYPKDSTFDLVAYSDSDYAGASLDRKSTTGGCQFLGCRLIYWQCKKQTVVATSSTKAEYVAAASCCAQVLWIQNQLLDYGTNTAGLNTPRCDEDRLELMELIVFLLPSDEKVRIEVSVVDLQVSAVRLILLLLVKSFCCLVNDVTRLQALVDKKKVVITEATLRDALRLDDVEGIECLPNEEIFVELARMGYEKPSTKLTFYKAFFSSQKEVGDLSSHTTKYSFPALTQKVFANMRRVGKGCSKVETPLFEGMIVEQQVDEGTTKVNVEDVSAAGIVAEGVISAADDEVPTAVEEPYIPSPTPPTPAPQPSQDQLSTSQVQLTPPQSPQARPPSPPHQPQPSQDAGISMAFSKTYWTHVKKLERRNKASKLQRLKKVGTAQRIETSNDTIMDYVSKQGRIIADMDANKDLILEDAKEVVVEKSADVEESADIQRRQAESQAQIYQINLKHANKVLSIQDDKVEPAELHEVIEVVTTAKLITEAVITASATITAAALQLTTATAPTLTAVAAPTLTNAPSAARRRKEVVIRNPQETATSSTIVHTEAKSKDKGKWIFVEEPKPLKKQAQIEQDEAYARELEAKLNKNIDWDEVIDHVQRKQKEDNDVNIYQALKRKPQTEAQARKNMMIYLRNTKERIDEEDSRALKRLNESQEDKAAKKQKLDEEVEELKRHLQIVPNDEDDVYTKATPLALKVLLLIMRFTMNTTNHTLKSKELTVHTNYIYEFPESVHGQELEAVRVLWCVDDHIHYNLVDFAGRKEISAYKVYSGSDAKDIWRISATSSQENAYRGFPIRRINLPPYVETAKYGKIWYDEDVHDLRSVKTEFPAIVFNDNLTSDKTLSCEPTVSFLNDNEIDFRISFDESDDEDYTVVFDKNSFSYKIIPANDLKTNLKNDKEKINMPLFPSPEPSVGCIDDLDFFKYFKNEFPAIVYNDALTSKSYFSTEPALCPQHIDGFNLKDETSLSECDEKEQNVLFFNDLFPFNVIYPEDLKSDKVNDDDKINIKQSSGDMSVIPLPNVINTDVDAYARKDDVDGFGPECLMIIVVGLDRDLVEAFTERVLISSLVLSFFTTKMTCVSDEDLDI
nr:hypothetical protein [Tanacetum cinerariifolium]